MRLYDTVKLSQNSVKEAVDMSEKRLNNTIYLMYLVSENYKAVHHLSSEQFLEMDRQYDILNYIAECPDIFDNMSEDEMVEEIEQYVSND